MVDFIIYMILIINIVIISFLLLVLYFSKKYIKYKNRKNLIFVSTAILSLIITILFETFLFHVLEDETHLKFEYSVEINSLPGKNEVVYVPITADTNIQNSLKITSGNGRINIIETEYGPCLEINFTRSIKFYGLLRIPEDINNINLTMENQTLQNQNRTKYDLIWSEYWIYYKPANTYGNNRSIRFESIYFHRGGRNHQVFEGYLISGWNLYRFRNRMIMYI